MAATPYTTALGGQTAAVAILKTLKFPVTPPSPTLTATQYESGLKTYWKSVQTYARGFSLSNFELLSFLANGKPNPLATLPPLLAVAVPTRTTYSAIGAIVPITIPSAPALSSKLGSAQIQIQAATLASSPGNDVKSLIGSERLYGTTLPITDTVTVSWTQYGIPFSSTFVLPGTTILEQRPGGKALVSVPQCPTATPLYFKPASTGEPVCVNSTGTSNSRNINAFFQNPDGYCLDGVQQVGMTLVPASGTGLPNAPPCTLTNLGNGSPESTQSLVTTLTSAPFSQFSASVQAAGSTYAQTPTYTNQKKLDTEIGACFKKIQDYCSTYPELSSGNQWADQCLDVPDSRGEKIRKLRKQWNFPDDLPMVKFLLERAAVPVPPVAPISGSGIQFAKVDGGATDVTHAFVFLYTNGRDFSWWTKPVLVAWNGQPQQTFATGASINLAMDCKQTPWSNWSKTDSCDVSNSRQLYTQTRSTLIQSFGTGAACGPLSQTKYDACSPCEGSWSLDYSPCENGTQYQTFSITKGATGTGAACPYTDGQHSNTRACSLVYLGNGSSTSMASAVTSLQGTTHIKALVPLDAVSAAYMTFSNARTSTNQLALDTALGTYMSTLQEAIRKNVVLTTKEQFQDQCSNTRGQYTALISSFSNVRTFSGIETKLATYNSRNLVSPTVSNPNSIVATVESTDVSPEVIWHINNGKTLDWWSGPISVKWGDQTYQFPNGASVKLPCYGTTTWTDSGECGPTGQKPQKSVFTKILEAFNGGATCPVSATRQVDCVKDCAGTWSNWGACTNGTQAQVFNVTQQPLNGGLACPSNVRTQNCGTDCVGNWTPWGACDPKTGKQSRTYLVATQASRGGLACPSPLTETQSCAVDCVGAWDSDWSECVDGSQTKMYTITTEAFGGGKACSDKAGDKKTQKCEVEAPKEVVEPPVELVEEEGSNIWLYVGGGVLLLIVLIIVAFMVLRKKK